LQRIEEQRQLQAVTGKPLSTSRAKAKGAEAQALTVKRMCALGQLSRAGFYRSLGRQPAEDPDLQLLSGIGVSFPEDVVIWTLLAGIQIGWRHFLYFAKIFGTSPNEGPFWWLAFPPNKKVVPMKTLVKICVSVHHKTERRGLFRSLREELGQTPNDAERFCLVFRAQIESLAHNLRLYLCYRAKNVV